MMSLTFAFWLFILLFGTVGAIRGWAKELLVSFSVVLSLAFTRLLERYVPMVSILDPDSTNLFWIRVSLLVVLVFFGYQTVHLSSRLAGKAARERLQDTLLGMVLGGFNGYLVVGTTWFYLDQARYPFPNAVTAPTGTVLETVTRMMTFMPPNLLGEPGIYFAVILAFIFVLVVYI
jgi:uncharacterized membrane protein required for colicin V production